MSVLAVMEDIMEVNAFPTVLKILVIKIWHGSAFH